VIVAERMAQGAGWSDEAMRALISLWSEANVQEKLDSVAKNQTIYKEITEGMQKTGQCRTKAKNLAQKYRKVISDE